MDGTAHKYDATKIQVLSGIDAVRKRPAMYIGDTSIFGLHHLVYEVVDNSVDEALAGFCTHISVVVHADNSVTVEDDGRGIPVDIHKTEKRPAVEVVMTVLHAGGKFDNKTYRVSGGLHGVGVSVVNALSEWLEVEVRREGKVYHQRYERGNTASPLEQVGKTKRNGTKVTFKPDDKIFETVEFDDSILTGRLKELAYLNAGVEIAFEDERNNTKEVFKYDGGLVSFVDNLNKNKKVLFTPVCYFKKTEKDEAKDVEIEIAFQYNDGYTESLFSFVNNVNTKEGGTHLTGFRGGLTRAINEYGKNNKFLEGDAALSGEDVREGLAAVISIKIPEPQFEGQTKTKLGNSRVRFLVEGAVYKEVFTFLEEHPDPGREIINKCLLTAKAREAARKARDLTRKKLGESGALPGKLADCSIKDPAKRELFMVEGDSAGGSAKQGRDRTFQAILPLKGKIINTEKAPLDKVLNNDEIKTMISAVGAGVDEDFDPAKVRYHKIIIMTDADVDGAHIKTLLLTFFYRKMTELIRGGYVYVAQPPLYKVKKGKKEFYVETESEMDRVLMDFAADNAAVSIEGKGKSALTPAQVTTLGEVSRRLGEIRRTIENKGIKFSDYLKARGESDAFPVYRAWFKDRSYFFADDKELSKFLEKQGTDAEEQDLFAAGEGPEKEGRPDYKLVELFESREMDKAYKRLRELGAEQLLEKPGIRIEENGKPTGCTAMQFYDLYKGIGKKGITVSRYKGLGEMNAEQLWETTMDPKERRLKRITVEDASKAEDMFTVLMGEEVEPRRQFIEKYAREVKNLDI